MAGKSSGREGCGGEGGEGAGVGRGEEASVGGEGVEALVVLEAAFESCSPHPAPPLPPRTLRSSSHSIRLKAISSGSKPFLVSTRGSSPLQQPLTAFPAT